MTLTAIGTLELMEEGQVVARQLGICPSFPRLSCVSDLSPRVTSSGSPASHPVFFLSRVATIIAHKGDGNCWLSVTTLPPAHHSLAVVAESSLIKQIVSLLAFVLGTNSNLQDAIFLAPGHQTLASLSSRLLASLPPSLVSNPTGLSCSQTRHVPDNQASAGHPLFCLSPRLLAMISK